MNTVHSNGGTEQLLFCMMVMENHFYYLDS